MPQHALAVRPANAGTCSSGPYRCRVQDKHLASADNGPATTSTQPFASTTSVGELYESLMSSRRRARERLLAMRDIERRHRDMPLVDLADLAVTGALQRPAPDRDDVHQA
jgi:hypothetical protein